MKIDLLWLNLSNPTYTCEYRQNRRQTVFKSFKIFLAESFLLYMSIKRTWMWNKAKNLAAKQGASQKPRRSHETPRPPLRTATEALSLLCDVRYSTMEKWSWEFLIYRYTA